MLFVPFILVMAMAGFAVPIFHLVSGEEIEAEVLSLREKQVAVSIGDSATGLIPYDRIAAIRMDGRLHTERLDRQGMGRLFPALAPATPNTDATRGNFYPLMRFEANFALGFKL